MKRLTINCLYCGCNTSFIISTNNDITNIKCFYCNETKLLKQSKIQPYIEPEEEKTLKEEKVKKIVLIDKNLDQSVNSGECDAYFPDLYDNFFRYSQ